MPGRACMPAHADSPGQISLGLSQQDGLIQDCSQTGGPAEPTFQLVEATSCPLQDACEPVEGSRGAE